MNLKEIFEQKWDKDLQYKGFPEDLKASMYDAFVFGYLYGVEASLEVLNAVED